MFRATAVVFSALILLPAAGTQEAAAPQGARMPLRQVELDFPAMQTSQPLVYDLTMHAESSPSGSGFDMRSTVILATEVLDHTVVFSDVWNLMGREYRTALHCDQTGGLPMLRGELELTRNGRVQSAVMAVRDGRLFVESDRDCIDVEHPRGTLLQAAAFRIVPQLPRVAGQAYTFPAYGEPLEMNVRSAPPGEAHRIICRGPESVQMPGELVQCTKYSLLAGRHVDFYVDGDNRLIKVVTDDGATAMTLREQIMAVSEDGEH